MLHVQCHVINFNTRKSGAEEGGGCIVGVLYILYGTCVVLGTRALSDWRGPDTVALHVSPDEEIC